MSMGNVVAPRKPKVLAYLLIAAFALACIVIGVIVFTQVSANNSGPNGSGSTAIVNANDSGNGPSGADSTAQAQAGDTDARYAAYSKLVEDYKSQYGTGRTEKASNGNLTQAKGLFLAELIDFDADGDEELLVGYYDESQANAQANGNAADAQAYRAEMWGYENGNAIMLGEPSFFWGVGEFACLPVYQNDNGMAIQLNKYDEDSQNPSFIANRICVLEGNSLNTVTEFGVYGLGEAGLGDAEERDYVIDGKSVDEDAYSSYFDNFIDSHNYKKISYWPMSNGNYGDEGAADWDTLVGPDDLITISNETAKKLNGGYANAGGDANAGASNTAADASDASAGAGGDASAPEDTGASNTAAGASDAWSQFPQDFSFMSGAGAWSTDLTVAADGTFTGCFHDSNMGDTGNGYPNGTRYETHFTGSFTTPVKVDDHEYRMQLATLKITDEPGEVIEDGVRVIHETDSVYGLGKETDQPTGEFSLHLPGQKLSAFSDNAASWLFLRYLDSDVTDFYAIVNSSDGQADLAFRTYNY